MFDLNLVSVIIPFRNRIGLLERAIDSVFQQSISTWEIILIDDCSSESLSTRYVENKRIRIIKNSQNMGPSFSRQLGLSLARGQYICFLDSDDVYHPYFLQTLLKPHLLDVHITFSYCTSVWLDRMNQIGTVYKTSNQTFNAIMPYLLLNNRPWNTSTLMWNRDYLASWNTDLWTWEDYLIEYQSSKLNNRIAHVQEKLCFIFKDEEEGLSIKAQTLYSISHRSKALQIMLLSCGLEDRYVKDNIIFRLRKEAAKASNITVPSVTFRRIFILIRPYSIFYRLLTRNQHWILFCKFLSLNETKRIYLKLNWL